MAQVCQHQPTPNLAYTYLGNAVRTAVSTGMNRTPQFSDPNLSQDSPSKVVSRTWWALYSLETEVSFAPGRSDIVGPDCYHNRDPPLINDTENTIISVMLGLSRILRKISKTIYFEHTGLSEKLKKATELDSELDNWLAHLPTKMRPVLVESTVHLGLTVEGKHWLKLQTLILKLRYLHAKVALFYLFFLHAHNKNQDENEDTQIGIYARRCKEAAVEMTNALYLAYCIHHTYRSSWNNTTYIMFSLSILLSAFAREPATSRSTSPNNQCVNQALEMLGVMDEYLVARNIAAFTLLATDTDPVKQNEQQQNGPGQLTSPGFACGNNPAPPPLKAYARAGANVTIQWTAVPRHHLGPSMSYLGLWTPGQKPQTVNFSKIRGEGYNAAKGLWANEMIINNNNQDQMKIPSDIKPGSYILRSELEPLHGNGQTMNPGLKRLPQFYTHCFNIEITGSGSAIPPGIKFPGGYPKNDPGVNLIFQNEAKYNSYPVPGPPVYTGSANPPRGAQPTVTPE